MKPGDCVCLKTGGYLMTVESVDDTGVYCVWFYSGAACKGVFAADALDVYTKKPRPRKVVTDEPSPQ